jgi:Rad3-related DNA helicase
MIAMKSACASRWCRNSGLPSVDRDRRELALEGAPLRRPRREVAEVVEPALADRHHLRVRVQRAQLASHSAVYSLAWCGCTPAVANSSPGCARASARAFGECSRLAPVTTIWTTPAARAHPRLVLEAPPGAGKTTRVPPALLDAPGCRAAGS